MEIKDVKANQGKVDIVATVVKKEEPRSFEKFGKKGRVCNAVIEDGTGKVTLTLWNDEVEKVNVGDKIHIENGWCSEFKNEKQVSAGKFGKIEILGASNAGVTDGAKQVFTNDPGMLKQAAGGDGDDEGNDDDSEEEPVSEEEFVE